MVDKQIINKENLETKFKLAEIKEIITVCDQIKEPYKKSCFEFLLNFHLEGSLKSNNESINSKDEQSVILKDKIDMPNHVIIFLQEFKLDKTIIEKLFESKDGEIKIHCTLPPAARGKQVIQLTLLLTLKNFIKDVNNNFSCTRREIDELCKKYRVLDDNISTHLKAGKRLFIANKNTSFKQGNNKSRQDIKYRLNVQGQQKLVETIEKIIKIDEPKN
ncbi:MAG: hypothetical protein R1F52_03325 [Candidatus Nitrosoabyssus spongiisocia]|nr:MAG: hypothetical protein R1F52_03325 [Nitrosopumilaceae archaeon AB1(1)]